MVRVWVAVKESTGLTLIKDGTEAVVRCYDIEEEADLAGLDPVGLAGWDSNFAVNAPLLALVRGMMDEKSG